MKKSNLKDEVVKLMYTATHAKVEPNSEAQEKRTSLNEILEEGSKLSSTEKFDEFAKEIGIDISNPTEEVEVNDNNFIKLQGEATMIRTLQIRLLMSDDVTEDKIKAFEGSDLYKQCKTIEAGLEDFKARNFGEMPNFSGNLKSDDLELGSNRAEEKINSIKEKIKSATTALEKENTLSSLELNKGNRDKVAMMALNSNPIGLGLINNSEKGIELMKQTPFKAKAARFGAIVGLLAAVGLFTALVSGFAIPAMAGAMGGIASAMLGAMMIGGANMMVGRMIPQVMQIGSKNEDNDKKEQRADIIKKVELNDKLSKDLLKDLKKQAKEYEKEISKNGKKQHQL